ncbi:hypothetical protein AXG93_1757s1050 [Marchantia polymorpha subsp. ruderalis]|uniref:DUF4371 domain-containing protein n=1 Tax=Marchantia polymorpha subsp. ruderalis TaxID=1480154 RepID=A0A176WMB6_MARPO|nr:hypothetical protein AXG93_1757s1050 [Marchantia polymorpha subsp. ruderalis]
MGDMYIVFVDINRPSRLLLVKAAPGTYLGIFGRLSVTIPDPAKAKVASKKKRKYVPLEVVVVEQTTSAGVHIPNMAVDPSTQTDSSQSIASDQAVTPVAAHVTTGVAPQTLVTENQQAAKKPKLGTSMLKLDTWKTHANTTAHKNNKLQCDKMNLEEADRFPDITNLFRAAGCKHIGSSHWTNDSGWKMADALDAVLVEELMHRVNDSPVITLTIDDSSACDLTQYMSHEILFIEDGQRRFEFLILQPLTTTNATSLTNALLASVQNVLGMSGEDLDLKFVAFGSNGASTIMGCHVGVAMQLVKQVASAMFPVFCVAHNTALVGGVIIEYALYAQIDAAVNGAHLYFARSSQRWVGFRYHANACNTPRLRML